MHLELLPMLTLVDCAYNFTHRKCMQTALMGEVALRLSTSEMLLNQQLSSLNLDVLSNEALCNVAYHMAQDNTLYYSSRYKRVKSRNSYTVKFKNVDGSSQYGQVQFFVSVSSQVFAFVLKLQTHSVSCQAHFSISHNSLDVLHVSKIVPIECSGGRMVCIPASNHISKCVFISIDDLCKCQYVVSFPNRLLHD